MSDAWSWCLTLWPTSQSQLIASVLVTFGDARDVDHVLGNAKQLRNLNDAYVRINVDIEILTLFRLIPRSRTCDAARSLNSSFASFTT